MQFVRPLSLLLLFAYPIAVHGGIITGVMWPALAVLLLLVMLPLLNGPPSPGRLIGMVVIGVAAYLLLQLSPPLMQKLIYAPPVLITLFLLLVFARSLMPGQRPLVTHIAFLLHDRPSPTVLRYTRGVTVAWVLFLAGMLAEVVYLGLYAEAETWSLFANFYNYLFIVLFFLCEFCLRRIFLSADERIPAPLFFRKLLHLDYRKLFWQ